METIHELAGQPPRADMLENIPRLVSAYYTEKPDPGVKAQRVAFGTSGHRGSSLDGSFNEDHILAVTQAICQYRADQGITGPLFIGMDTHALSEPAFATALEVLAANGVEVMIDSRGGYTPTPAVSHAILKYNRGRDKGKADGIVITPSHNPPGDGGFKYNPPHGGPADTTETGAIQKEANRLLAANLDGVRRISYSRAKRAAHWYDYTTSYVNDLGAVLDLEAIKASGVKIGVDPLGGAGVSYWDPIRERYDLDIQVVRRDVDPTFRFMTCDKDGKIRMDCSSKYAMASLIRLKDEFDVAFGNDTDYDRHGIVTRKGELLQPNHYLCVAVRYLFTTRKWGPGVGIGKTAVSTALIDRIAADLKRPLKEVPVGFKFFVDGLLTGTLGFGGEESAGASFLRKDGTVWTTDKDGIILGLLAAEICATTDKDPWDHYLEIAEEYGTPVFERIESDATPEEKERLSKVSAAEIGDVEIAGETAETSSDASGRPIGGIKIVLRDAEGRCDAWVAARPSGTENKNKLYGESFRGKEHLQRIQADALKLLDEIFRKSRQPA